MEMTASGGSLAKVSVYRSGATQRWRVGRESDGAFAANGHLIKIKTEAKPGQSQSVRKGDGFGMSGLLFFIRLSDLAIFLCLTKFIIPDPPQKSCL